MIIHLPAEKDTFITNKTIRNSFSASDANTGYAGTIELFKLYGESTYPTTESIELSRALVKFDFDKIRELTGSYANLISAGKFFLRMYDVKTTSTVPSNFNVIVFPMKKTWTEGVGLDVVEFEDLGSANWISSSDNATWDCVGASGTSDIYETSGTYQLFPDGTEDMYLDISTICSQTLAGIISDYGFLVSLSGSEETDSETRYKKIFFSRHSAFEETRPRIDFLYDDSIRDHRKNVVFDSTRSIYLYNMMDGAFYNLFSGTTELTSANQISVKIWQTATNAIHGHYSDSRYATWIRTGIYSMSFYLDSFSNALSHSAFFDKSASFLDYWKFDTSDAKHCFFTGSFDVAPNKRINYLSPIKNYKISMENLASEYKSGDEIFIRVFVQDCSPAYRRSRSYVAREDETILTFDNMHWRVRNLNTGEIIIPIDRTYNSTRLSYDGAGMYFKFFTDCLSVGDMYKFEFSIIENGHESYFDSGFSFRVVN